MAKRIEKLIGRLLSAFGMIAGGLLLLIAVIITVDVTKRWFTGKPILGVFEGVELLMVAVTMLVLGMVEWQHRQLNVDVFSHRARGRSALFLVVLDKALTLLFIGVLVTMSAGEWLKAYSGWFLRRGMVEIPIVYPMGLIVTGAVLTFVAAAWGLGKAIWCLVSGAPYEVPDRGISIGGREPGTAGGSS